MLESQERRRAARISLIGRPGPRTEATRDVRLLDLSTIGARIEVGDLLHKGTSYALELPPALGTLSLSARVVWSSLLGGKQTTEGEQHLIYQSGLVFVDLTPDQQAALASIVQHLTDKDGAGQGHD
jgi:hypothetical protein